MSTQAYLALRIGLAAGIVLVSAAILYIAIRERRR